MSLTNDSTGSIQREYRRIDSAIKQIGRSVHDFYLAGIRSPGSVSQGQLENLARRLYQANSDIGQLEIRQASMEERSRSRRPPLLGTSRFALSLQNIASLRPPITDHLREVAQVARGHGYNGDQVLEAGRRMFLGRTRQEAPPTFQHSSNGHSNGHSSNGRGTLPRISADVPPPSYSRRRSNSMGHRARPSISAVAEPYFETPRYRPASAASNYRPPTRPGSAASHHLPPARPGTTASNYPTRPPSTASNYATPLSRPASATSWGQDVMVSVSRRLADVGISPGPRSSRQFDRNPSNSNPQFRYAVNADRHDRAAVAWDNHVQRMRSSRSHAPSTSGNHSASTTSRAHRLPTPAQQRRQDLDQNQGAGSSTSQNYSSSTTSRAHRPTTPAEQRLEDLGQNQGAGSSHTKTYYYTGPKR
jgi:hypothetical protein